MGGSLSSAHAVYFRGSGESSSVSSMVEFAKEEGFKILAMSKDEGKINESIEKNVKVKSLKKRLLKQVKEIKDMEDYEKLLKSGQQMHKIKVKDMHYLIRLDEVSIYAASNASRVKFYNKNNQRNYDIVAYLGKKYGFEIKLVADSSSLGERAEMNANIRSQFSGNVRAKLLKGAERIFKDAESFRAELKSGNKVFEGSGYYRVKVGDLDYVIYKK